MPKLESAGGVAQDADTDAPFEGRGIRSRYLFDELDLSPPRNDADDLRNFASRRRQLGSAREDRFPHRNRHRTGARGEYFGDEERVAARDAVNALGVPSGSSCKLSNSGLGKRRKRYSARARLRHVADDEA